MFQNDSLSFVQKNRLAKICKAVQIDYMESNVLGITSILIAHERACAQAGKRGAETFEQAKISCFKNAIEELVVLLAHVNDKNSVICYTLKNTIFQYNVDFPMAVVLELNKILNTVKKIKVRPALMQYL